MGRYYSGDIDGKFWFAVQSSSAADRFGVTGEAAYLSYYFGEEDLEEVEAEIERIETELGDQLKVIEDFFASRDSYNDSELEASSITKYHLAEYADLQMGIKIRDCIKENGSCSFEAEL
jgi:hypothetical protein